MDAVWTSTRGQRTKRHTEAMELKSTGAERRFNCRLDEAQEGASDLNSPKQRSVLGLTAGTQDGHHPLAGPCDTRHDKGWRSCRPLSGRRESRG